MRERESGRHKSSAHHNKMKFSSHTLKFIQIQLASLLFPTFYESFLLHAILSEMKTEKSKQKTY
jgi:hypothetical protein